MTGLYCVCPPLGHLPGTIMGVLSVGLALWRVTLECGLYTLWSRLCQGAESSPHTQIYTQECVLVDV